MQEVVDEIKDHIRRTASPHSWWGHSHTKPIKGAVVVYLDEFDVPAKDTVDRVAPCPCCNPFHAQYKNKGKIAWFPEEHVIRLIGPLCFKAINKASHSAALIDLKRRQKAREETSTIDRHRVGLPQLIEALETAMPIAVGLDEFMADFDRQMDTQTGLHLWREVKGGQLFVVEKQNTPFIRKDGSIGRKEEEFRRPFAAIAGYAMIDRSGAPAAAKLGPLKAGLAKLLERLSEISSLDELGEVERPAIATALVKGRLAAQELLASVNERQKFLTSDAIGKLDAWGRHPNAPLSFTIEIRKRWVYVASTGRVQKICAVKGRCGCVGSDPRDSASCLINSDW